MLSTFLAVLRRDLLLAWRGRADVLVTLAFFIIVVCLFPFGVGAEPNQLRAIAPAVAAPPVRAGLHRRNSRATSPV